jgi:pentose-5-phosphate-3-epimerase
MGESEEHKNLKKCAANVFGGYAERAVNGRVDVKAPTFCVEIETTGRTDRVAHAINKLESSSCGGGFLIVPHTALDKATKLLGERKDIIPVSSESFKKICEKK